MKYQPKNAQSFTFYLQQRNRVLEKINSIKNQIDSLQPYPIWIHTSFNLALSPFSKKVRSFKARVRALREELNRLTHVINVFSEVAL